MQLKEGRIVGTEEKTGVAGRPPLQPGGKQEYRRVLMDPITREVAQQLADEFFEGNFSAFIRNLVWAEYRKVI